MSIIEISGIDAFISHLPLYGEEGVFCFIQIKQNRASLHPFIMSHHFNVEVIQKTVFDISEKETAFAISGYCFSHIL